MFERIDYRLLLELEAVKRVGARDAIGHDLLAVNDGGMWGPRMLRPHREVLKNGPSSLRWVYLWRQLFRSDFGLPIT
jgi:hypothetical protein